MVYPLACTRYDPLAHFRGNFLLDTLNDTKKTVGPFKVRLCGATFASRVPCAAQVVHRIDLSGLVCAASRLNCVAADYGDDGRRPFVYVTDAATRAVIAWDVTAGRGHRAVLPEAVARGRTAGRDVLCMALARWPGGRGAVLYLTYLTGGRMYSVDARDVRRGRAGPGAVATDLGPKPDRAVMLGTDGRTTVYFRYGGRGDVYAWDAAGAGGFGVHRFAPIRRADDGRGRRLTTHVMPGHRGADGAVGADGADGTGGAVVVWSLESDFPDYVSGNVGSPDVRLRPLVVADAGRARSLGRDPFGNLSET